MVRHFGRPANHPMRMYAVKEPCPRCDKIAHVTRVGVPGGEPIDWIWHLSAEDSDACEALEYMVGR